MQIKVPEYYVYIITNPTKTTLYTGVTNDLSVRLAEHWKNRGNPKSFSGKYYCYNLLYFERFDDISSAIERETQIKKWSRAKKAALINAKNPAWVFLNQEVCGQWPPFDVKDRT